MAGHVANERNEDIEAIVKELCVSVNAAHVAAISWHDRI